MTQSSGLSGAVHHPWEEVRRTVDWDLPQGERFGLHRGIHTRMESSDVTATMIRVPAGQSSPLHRSSVESVVVGLTGEVEFVIAGERAVVAEFDLLQIPADVPRSFSNYGFTDAVFFVAEPRAAGEPVVVYREDESETGWDEAGCEDVSFMKWEEYRRKVVYRGGFVQEFGSHRGVHPHIAGTSLKGHVVRVPAGQGSPWHTIGGDCIFLGLHGEFEVYAEKQAFRLNPMDVLVLPPPDYALRNVGLTDGLYFSVNTKASTTTKMTYYAPAAANDPLAGPGEIITP